MQLLVACNFRTKNPNLSLFELHVIRVAQVLGGENLIKVMFVYFKCRTSKIYSLPFFVYDICSGFCLWIFLDDELENDPYFWNSLKKYLRIERPENHDLHMQWNRKFYDDFFCYTVLEHRCKVPITFLWETTSMFPFFPYRLNSVRETPSPVAKEHYALMESTQNIQKSALH